MALKAEVPLLSYIKTSLKCKTEEKEKAATGSPLPAHTSLEQDGAHANVVDAGEQVVPNLVAGANPEEPGVSWREEYLIAKRSGRDRSVCMVCGGILSASGPAAAREHILQHHAHSLDFTLEEKRNILEAWSEGAVLPEAEPCPAGSPSESKQPAEIEVLLDSEEQPSSQKRGQLKPRCEAVCFDPGQRSQGLRRRHSSGSTKDARTKPASKGKEWSTEGGLPGSAPAEIRIFTDGTFPAGFTLKLYCRTQPEPPQDSKSKPDTRKRKVDRDCSVSLLRLHSTDPSRRLCPRKGAATCPLSNVKDFLAKPGQQENPVNKSNTLLLSESFNPAWRARFLMDFDAAAGQLVCMVCEYPLRRVCLASVKQHILQCHAETLHLPREVRRTIREVWETRGQTSTQAARK